MNKKILLVQKIRAAHKNCNRETAEKMTAYYLEQHVQESIKKIEEERRVES